MPSVYDLKRNFQRVLRPFVDRLHRAGVRPNHLTLLALGLSGAVGAAVLLARHDLRWLLVLPPWLFLRMALNAMDGMLAREHGLITRLGGALNEAGDVLADLALYLPLAAVRPEAAIAVVAFNFGAVFTEFCGLVGPSLGASRRYEGPMGKSDRAFWVGVLGLLGPWVPASLHYWSWIFSAAALLALLTGFNRLRAALKETEGKGAA
jgi:CDP-diacylglycerol--glycerol-3-phosphate 3-phosphatidyltransferase